MRKDSLGSNSNWQGLGQVRRAVRNGSRRSLFRRHRIRHQRRQLWLRYWKVLTSRCRFELACTVGMRLAPLDGVYLELAQISFDK